MKYALGLGSLVFAALTACSADVTSVDGASASEELATALPENIDRPGHTVRASTATTVKYYGGAVIPNAKVYVVWWGTGSNLNASITKPVGGIADFYAGVLNSPFMDGMSQYSTNVATQAGSHSGQPGTGQVIGRGNYAGTIALTAIPPSTSLTDDQIQQTIETAIGAGNLPQPDDNTLYAIYFPRTVKISIDGMQSCVMFGAYHFQTPMNQHHAAYAVMPDCGYSFSGVTSVSSHELAEAVSDATPTAGSNPDFPQAWNDSQGNEIGDLCTGSGGSVTTAKGPFNVQGIWDESSHGCKVAHSFAQDFSVSASDAPMSLAAGSAQTVTFQTSTVNGTAQPLTLSVSAPAGVTATLSSTTINSGDSVTVTMTANQGVTVKDGQVVVTAQGTTGSAPSYHAASLLVQVAAQ
jgi:hypothetical protein